MTESNSVEWRNKWTFEVPPPPHPTFDLEAVIRASFDEDSAGIGDLTTLATIPAETNAVATFLAKEDGVIAGLGVAEMVFKMQDESCTVEWSVKEGDRVKTGLKFGVVRGPARAVLVGERVALNLMQRMSGVATATRKMVDQVEGHRAKILETRKTIPGLRLLDKWAVLIGGGSNHRMGLFDMMMIKDNHITAAGGVTPALQRAEKYLKDHDIRNVDIEIEARTLDEVEEVLSYLAAHPATRVRRLMLDNMAVRDAAQEGGVEVSMLQEAVSRVDGRIRTEASGNVTLETVRRIAATGVDYISSGALTHSVKAMDISLKIVTGV